ncbi:MAG: DUF4837 family protein [Bacteroidota bacterium]|nr:DUF4837 family protein [Rhodothermia bacterium]MDW8286199.1 DUF4837 family protein [Bacteroidota bacterium]
MPRSELLLPLVLLGAACRLSPAEFLPPSVGRPGLVTIAMDSAAWAGPLGEAVREVFGSDVETLPQPEPWFDLAFKALRDQAAFERLKRDRNIVFVAPLDGPTPASAFIRARLDSAVQAYVRAGNPLSVSRQNLWAQDQQVLYLTAAGEQDLIRFVREKAPELRALFDRVERTRTEQDLFRRAEQVALADSLLRRHGWRVRIQHDYLIAKDTANFVWVRRLLPDNQRWFFVWWRDRARPDQITPAWILRVRDSLTQRHLRGKYEDSYVTLERRRPVQQAVINFHGRFAYESRGLWRMTGDAMGGPFVNITFFDPGQQRIYMLDGSVFAPRYDKREFLRQMEAILYTFRTQAELNSASKREPGS